MAVTVACCSSYHWTVENNSDVGKHYDPHLWMRRPRPDGPSTLQLKVFKNNLQLSLHCGLCGCHNFVSDCLCDQESLFWWQGALLQLQDLCPPSLQGSLHLLWLPAPFVSSLAAQVLRTLKADSFGLLVMECFKIEPKWKIKALIRFFCSFICKQINGRLWRVFFIFLGMTHCQIHASSRI